MSERPAPDEQLYERIVAILDEARSRIARTVNTTMVHAYWFIGREIVEVEQQGADRAAYGEQLLELLARRLTQRFGRGTGVATLRRARSFYRTFPRGSAIRAASGGPEIRSTALIESGGAEIRSTALIESGGAEIRSTALAESEGAGARFPPMLGWSHDLVLLRVSNPQARTMRCDVRCV